MSIKIFIKSAYVPSKYTKKTKIIFLSTTFFCWIMLIAFGSNTVSLMSNVRIKLPFTDLKSFVFDSDYYVVTSRSTVSARNLNVRKL